MSKTLNDTGYKSFHSYIRGSLDKTGRPPTDILCHSVSILAMVLSSYMQDNTSPCGEQK